MEAQFPVGPFLGPYVPPGDLGRDALRSEALLPEGSFAETLAEKTIIANAIKGALEDLVIPGRESFSGWTEAISRAFLEPYGLDLQNGSITAYGTRDNVSARLAAAYPDVPLYTAMATPDRPFPVILGSIMRVDTPRVFYPFEVTPLYVGDPARNFNVTPPLGPGFIEPLGFNSPPPDGPPPPPAGALGEQGPLNVTPYKLVPLATYVGISSSFISQGTRPSSSAAFALTGTERLEYWSPANYSTGDSGTLSFADGAGADNIAITPLLRRRVTQIMACVAALTPAERSPADWAVAQYDLAGLFGAVPLNATSYKGLENGLTGVMPDIFNTAHQVFPREGYDELYDSLRGSLAHGQPAIHRASYAVQSNPDQAIIGGWQVEVLWIVNSRADQWEERLPDDTKAFLNLSRGDTGSALHAYPHISTFTAKYPPELVTLLGQQATWAVLQAAQELWQLLKDAGAEPPGAAQKATVAANATVTRRGVFSGGNATASAPTAVTGNMSQAAAAAPIPLNLSSLPPGAVAAAAALIQLAQAPPAVQLAGVVPPAAQRQAAQMGGGLSADVRQPRNSYTMAINGGGEGGGGRGGSAAVVLQPTTNQSVSTNNAVGSAQGRWWRAGLTAVAAAIAKAAHAAIPGG